MSIWEYMPKAATNSTNGGDHHQGALIKQFAHQLAVALLQPPHSPAKREVPALHRFERRTNRRGTKVNALTREAVKENTMV